MRYYIDTSLLVAFVNEKDPNHDYNNCYESIVV